MSSNTGDDMLHLVRNIAKYGARLEKAHGEKIVHLPQAPRKPHQNHPQAPRKRHQNHPPKLIHPIFLHPISPK